jgi:hypothetical protein
MAVEEVKIKVTADTSDAQDNLKKTEKGLDGVKKGADKAADSGKKAGGAFATIGTALKSLGIITVVVKAFEFLQDMLMKNEKVAKFFAVGIEFVTRVFSDLVNFLVDNIPAVIGFFKDIFENPVENLKAFGEAIKKNLIERFESFIDTLGFIGTAIKELFSGNFSAAADAAKKAGKEVADVFTGVNNSFDKTVEAVGKASEAIVDYTKKTYAAAEAGVELKNAAAIAASQAELAAAKFKRQAEEQRQIRDNVDKSLDERIAANKELSVILDKQLKQELSAAGLAVAAAKYELDKNKSIENQIALNQALAALEGKREEITGQRSEQLVNEVGLQKEKLELSKLASAAEIKLGLDQRKASADLIKDELEKLAVKRQIAVDESALEIARLEENIKNTTAGTTARVQAEIEFRDKKAAIASEIIAIDDNIAVATLDRRNKALEQQASNQQLDFAFRQQAIDEEFLQLQIALDSKLISQEAYNEKYRGLSQQRIAIDQEEFQFNQELQQKKEELALAGLNLLQSIVGENEKLSNLIFAIQKGFEIAKIISSTASAIGQVSAGVAAVPAILPPGIPNPAAIAAAVLGAKKVVALKIGAAAQIAAIAAASVSKFKGGGSVNLPSPQGATASAPNSIAPVAPPKPVAQVTTLDQASINRMGSAANRAYVVESDITGSQNRQARISRAARLA